jgi:hypothetical protein
VSCLSHSFRLDAEIFTVGRRRVHLPRRYLCIWPGNLTYQLCTPEAVRPRPRRRLFLAYLHALPQAAAPATARSSPGDISPHFRPFPLLAITCFDVRPHPRVCDVWRCGRAVGQSPASRAVPKQSSCRHDDRLRGCGQSSNVLHQNTRRRGPALEYTESGEDLTLHESKHA